MGDFFKNTLQIGPYAKGITKDEDLDLIAQRRLINI